MVALYRTMTVDNDGMPLCGSKDGELGARVPRDIKPDAADNVHPATGGMSVFLDPQKIHPHFRPVMLGGLSALPLFSISSDALGDSLVFQEGKRSHGVVGPKITMALPAFQRTLCNTRTQWILYSWRTRS